MTPFEYAFAGTALLEMHPERLLAAEQIPEFARELLELEPDLEREYVRLFLNPAGAPCLPWQSAHEGECKLMGPAHGSALGWYARYGAQPATASEQADHAGLLLTFYAQLLAIGVDDSEAKSFASRHLTWLPAFAESIVEQSQSQFYRSFALWLIGGLAVDGVSGTRAAGAAP